MSSSWALNPCLSFWPRLSWLPLCNFAECNLSFMWTWPMARNYKSSKLVSETLVKANFSGTTRCWTITKLEGTVCVNNAQLFKMMRSLMLKITMKPTRNSMKLFECTTSSTIWPYCSVCFLVTLNRSHARKHSRSISISQSHILQQQMLLTKQMLFQDITFC